MSFIQMHYCIGVFIQMYKVFYSNIYMFLIVFTLKTQFFIEKTGVFYLISLILENKPTINQIGGKVIVKNLACVEITDMIQLVQLIKKAARARITDKTQYNERSSRSHCIYRMNISYHNEKDKEGVLNIVDLAGSERSSSQFMEDMANEKDKEKVKLLLIW